MQAIYTKTMDIPKGRKQSLGGSAFETNKPTATKPSRPGDSKASPVTTAERRVLQNRMKSDKLKKVIPEQTSTALTSRRHSLEDVYGTSQEGMGSGSRDQVLDLRNVERQVPEISSASGGRVEANLTLAPSDRKEGFDKNKI